MLLLEEDLANSRLKQERNDEETNLYVCVIYLYHLLVVLWFECIVHYFEALIDLIL